MKLTKFPYISHTGKDGFVWKKRINDRTVYISLKTRDLNTAQMRAASLTGKVVMVKKLNLPFDALKLTLRRHRDELADMAWLEQLTGGISPVGQNWSATELTFSEGCFLPTAQIRAESQRTNLSSEHKR